MISDRRTFSSKGIIYTEEFKHIFIVENEKGKFPREIFEECGFDIEVIGIMRVESSSKDGVLLIGKTVYQGSVIHERGTPEDLQKRNLI